MKYRLMMNLIRNLVLVILSYIYTSLASKIAVVASCDSIYTNAYRRTVDFARDKLRDSNTDVLFKCYDHSSIGGYKTMCDLVDERVVAVITLGGSSEVAKESEFFSQVGIPIISVGASNPFLMSPSRQFLIRMVPPDTFQGAAIFDLLTRFKWKDISILGSADDYGINGLIKLQDLISRDRDITIRNIQYFDTVHKNGSNSIKENLRLIKKSLTKIIILNCSAKYAKAVFEEARKMNLLSSGYVWITTDSITSRPEVILEHERNKSIYDGLLGTIQAVDIDKTFIDDYLDYGGFTNETTVWIAILFDAIMLSDQVLTVNGTTINTPQINCHTPDSWKDGHKFLEAIKNSNFKGVTGDISFFSNGLIMRTLYSIMNKRGTKFVKVGSWDKTTGLSTLSDRIEFLGNPPSPPSSDINTLSGQHLKFGAIPEAPYAFKNRSKFCKGREEHPECWYGFCIELNNKLAKDLNFTYELLEPPDGEYGMFSKKLGTYTGLILQLQERNIDLASAPLTINTERSIAVDFLSDIIHVKSTSVYLSGSEAYSNRFFFLGPLDPFVWAAIVAVIFFLGVLITCLNYISPVSRYNKEKGGDKSPSVYNNVFIVASGFVGREGGDGIPESPAAR